MLRFFDPLRLARSPYLNFELASKKIAFAINKNKNPKKFSFLGQEKSIF
jgi:hypothetical protein